jgi:methylphosphotriester-DNA--protein-cysteine methyltransferase
VQVAGLEERLAAADSRQAADSAREHGDRTPRRVVRLRRLIALGDEPLASRALAAGYASHAHMNDEVCRLTGTTPVRFPKDATLTAA